MDRSQLLSVVTPVSRPELLTLIAPAVPLRAEWLLVTDGPLALPPGLRDHVHIDGPATGQWGNAQRQVGLEAATRPFVTFLDDDNVMLPMLAELVLPVLEASGADGALFGLLLRHPAGFYAWPPPVRVERSQVDTAMFLGQTAAARAVGWPDHGPGPGTERSADFMFLRAFETQRSLLRLPGIFGFHDGVACLRHHEPEVLAALGRGEDVGAALLAVLHRHMGQADAPPWWKGARALSGSARAPAVATSPPVPARAPAPGAHSAIPALEVLAAGGNEGSADAGQRAQLADLVRGLAADRPGQAVNVLEIGFNAGLSAATFLEASEQAHVVSFDLGEHGHVPACLALLRDRYPHRVDLVTGDSRQTLPRFVAAAGARFDLILVDGGHEEDTCRADVFNARAAAAPGAIVVVDDLMPHKAYGAGVCRAWDGLLADGTLVAPRLFCTPSDAAEAVVDDGGPAAGCHRRWGVASFGA